MNEIIRRHIYAVEKEVEEGRMTPTNSISMNTVNLDKFTIENIGGETNIAELVKLKKHIDAVIVDISNSIEMLMMFHKDSPIKNWDELEKHDGAYNISLNLGSFMDVEENVEELFFGQSNYELAEKLMSEYKDSGEKTKGIIDVSYRDLASWEIKSKAKAKKLIKFIEDKYIAPRIKEIMDVYNIKKVVFDEKSIDFEYN